METLKDFTTILVTLTIIMDPLGNLPFLMLFTERHTPAERLKVAAIASAFACVILIFFGVTGDAVLRFFGITLPAFQIAGGFIFFIYSLQMLHLIPSGIKSTEEEEQEGIARQNVALVPLGIPLLAGPGAITAVLVWQQSSETPLSSPLLASAVILACLITFIIFYLGERIYRLIGVGGIRVVTRIMGLLLAVIAVQFIVDGIQRI